MINKLQLDDFELSYITEGEGRDVLFLHGFPSNMYFWNDIKNELKNKLRVTVVEQRGYPLSSIEDSIVSDFNIENLSLDIEKLINKIQLTHSKTRVTTYNTQQRNTRTYDTQLKTTERQKSATTVHDAAQRNFVNSRGSAAEAVACK